MSDRPPHSGKPVPGLGPLAWPYPAGLSVGPEVMAMVREEIRRRKLDKASRLTSLAGDGNTSGPQHVSRPHLPPGSVNSDRAPAPAPPRPSLRVAIPPVDTARQHQIWSPSTEPQLRLDALSLFDAADRVPDSPDSSDSTISAFSVNSMDPFEVRVRFTNLVVNLNASVTSATKAAQYALKYRDMDEDLHSCILEQLEMPRNSMNNRANIMFFIEHLCDMATREKHVDYVRMVQRDMVRIVDAVAPEDGSGAANVKVVRKVLQALGAKDHLQTQTVGEIEDLLKDRDAATHDLSSPTTAAGTGFGDGDAHMTNTQAPVPTKFDKKAIEQRIEEDRERHKRLRENIWAVPQAVQARGGAAGAVASSSEYDQMWEDTSDLGADDFDMMRDEAEEHARFGADFMGGSG